MQLFNTHVSSNQNSQNKKLKSTFTRETHFKWIDVDDDSSQVKENDDDEKISNLENEICQLKTNSSVSFGHSANFSSNCLACFCCCVLCRSSLAWNSFNLIYELVARRYMYKLTKMNQQPWRDTKQYIIILNT